jgi:multiple sugar transport system ATP-binding protein
MAEVALKDVSKSFGTVEAVRGLSLSIADGEFVVLLGPTGAGKTTTLRLIAGLDRPDRGDIVIQGRVVTREVPAERDVAFVFQQYSLYPHLTVYDNLAFPLRSPARRLNEVAIRRRVQQVSELLHIEQKLGNRATALSGGEMQRVAIGRALVREPAVYLMDEPLSSLDAKLRAELRLELKRIQRELGTTILYVTHDQIEAMTMADRIGVMNEGVLIQLGTPREIYEQPNSAYVASRLGTPAINLIPAELLGRTALPPQARTVGLRTEHIRISSPDRRDTPANAPLAEVHWVEHLGDQNHVHLKLATHSLVTLADPVQELKAGDQVSLEFAEPLYFDQAGNRVQAQGFQAKGFHAHGFQERA